MGKDEANGTLLENYRTESGGPMPAKTPLLIRVAEFADRFKLRSALGHLGLLVALCLYCVFGGLVSWFLVHSRCFHKNFIHFLFDRWVSFKLTFFNKKRNLSNSELELKLCRKNCFVISSHFRAILDQNLRKLRKSKFSCYSKKQNATISNPYSPKKTALILKICTKLV